MKQLILLLMPLIALVTSCKKAQPPMSVLNQGCDCATEVSAGFEILELEKLPQFNPIGTDTDTIFRNKNVIFRANEENAEYTWYIGSEIVHTKEVGRYFSSAFDNQVITVSLVVKKKPNSICLPNDDGYDSISRTFYVQPYGACDYTNMYVNDTTFLEGIYRMKSANSQDSFDIIVDYIDRQTAIGNEVDIYNFDGMGSNLIGQPRCIETFKNYRQIWFSSSAVNYKCFTGYLHYRMNGAVEFVFTTCQGSPGNWVTIEHNLHGRKL